MNLFTVLSVASSIGQAFTSFQQGAAMKAYYDAQADLASLQYATKRVEAKEAGVQALRATNSAIASIAAKGAAGGILSTNGSVLLQQNISIARGAEDLRLAQLNQDILSNVGQVQYNNFLQAGRVAEQQGVLGGLFGLGTDIVNINDQGLFRDPAIPKPSPNQYDYEAGIKTALKGAVL
jgi:hypothetical protein